MPPSYPLWECPSKASSQLMSPQDQGSFQPAGRRVEPSSVCHRVPRLKEKKKRCPTPFSLFSAPTGSSAAGSQSRQPAGWLSAARRGKGGSQGCPTQPSKEACSKLGYHEVFLQRFLSREVWWGTVTHFPLSHNWGCLRFMSHLYGFATYLASWP